MPFNSTQDFDRFKYYVPTLELSKRIGSNSYYNLSLENSIPYGANVFYVITTNGDRRCFRWKYGYFRYYFTYCFDLNSENPTFIRNNVFYDSALKSSYYDTFTYDKDSKKITLPNGVVLDFDTFYE